MRRRDLLVLAASAAAIRNPALAETNTPRIGFVQVGSPQDNQGLLDAFRENLSALGWTDGSNIAVLDRWAEERAERRHPGHRRDAGHARREARERHDPDRPGRCRRSGRPRRRREPGAAPR